MEEGVKFHGDVVKTAVLGATDRRGAGRRGGRREWAVAELVGAGTVRRPAGGVGDSGGSREEFINAGWC